MSLDVENFLKRAGYFSEWIKREERPKEAREVFEKEALVDKRKPDFLNGSKDKARKSIRVLSYQPTNIEYTRDSLFWSWRRVKEYYQELGEEEETQLSQWIKRKELKRLMGR